MGLPTELVEQLLNKSDGYPRAAQVGPLRFYDVAKRCASRGCSTTTYCTVEGVPYCMIHSLRKLNEIITELEGESSGN